MNTNVDMITEIVITNPLTATSREVAENWQIEDNVSNKEQNGVRQGV